jgi:hypothetical protein
MQEALSMAVLTHESGSSKISMLPEGIQIFFVAI